MAESSLRADSTIYATLIQATEKYSATMPRRQETDFTLENEKMLTLCFVVQQGGRTWQPLVGSKNGNENFRQARIYNFRVKCVVLARYRCKIISVKCNSAILAQEKLFLTQKGTFLPKDLQKVRKLRQILICNKIAYARA